MADIRDGLNRRYLNLFFITALLLFYAGTENLLAHTATSAHAAAVAAKPASASGGGVNCAGVPTWQNNGTLYQAYSYVIDPANNSEYKALVTCWGYNGEPSTSPTLWSYVGVCGGTAPTSTPSFTSTFTWTWTSTPTKTPDLFTATSTNTFTPALTATFTLTPSVTNTPVLVSTNTPTLSATFTATPTITASFTSTATLAATSTATSTMTVTPTLTFTATSASGGCAGVAVWQNNSTLYQAGSLAVDPVNNGEYKALVTCWGYNGEPSTSPTLWSYVGPCGSTGGSTATATITSTKTNTATLTATPACGTNYPASASVTLTLQGQQESEWCWAASSSMEMSFFGVNITQCSQATAEYGTNCCVDNQCDYYAEGATCNPDAGGVVDIGSYGFNAQGSCEGTFPNTGTTLTFAQIEQQIYCQKLPYIFAWNWDGGGGHVMVVVGYDIDPVMGQMVEVDDPLPDCTGANRLMTYGDYVGEVNGVYYTSDPDGGEHSHQCDIYDVTYSGGN